MPTEIERKFLVRPDALANAAPPGVARSPARGARFTQGYLCTSPVVRVRLAEHPDGRAEAWLTIKGPGKITRGEYEYAIPYEHARELLALCAAVLAKTRYHVPVGAHTWDLDEFHGAHAGLWLAEVELSRPDETFERPPWLGAEVTDDPRYTNAALATAGGVPSS